MASSTRRSEFQQTLDLISVVPSDDGREYEWEYGLVSAAQELLALLDQAEGDEATTTDHIGKNTVPVTYLNRIEVAKSASRSIPVQGPPDGRA